MSSRSKSSSPPRNPPRLRRRSSKLPPLALVCVDQAPPVFFKDEGGKSNFMSVSVCLSDQKGPLPCEEFALRSTLYFESGEKVMDSSVLTLIGNQYEPPVISAEDGTATVNFRLEKVSRRKDGQRFKLFIEPDVNSFPLAAGISGVFTTCINVLSKRKGRSSSNGSDDKPSAKKRQKVDNTQLEGLEERIGAQVTQLQTATRHLLQMVRMQSERIIEMELAFQGVMHRLPLAPTAVAIKAESKVETKAQGKLHDKGHKPALQVPLMPRMPLLKVTSSGSTSFGSSASDNSAALVVAEVLEDVVNGPPSTPVRARMRTFGSTGSLLGCLGGLSGLINVEQLEEEGAPGVLKLDRAPSVSFDLSTMASPSRPALRGSFSSGFEFTFDAVV